MLDSSASVDDILAYLGSISSQETKVGMDRYGIETTKAFGVPNSVLRPLARRLGRDHQRALQLWDSGWREARLLACFTEEKNLVTQQQAQDWANDFASWEIVDHASDLFVDSRLHDVLIPEFSADNREFVRRSAFAMMAWGAVHLKKEPDDIILAWLPLIEQHARDDRNFVKKAVNWALRQIGKRSLTCHGPALDLARKLAEEHDSTARWIGRDAYKELTAQKTLERLEAKSRKLKS